VTGDNPNGKNINDKRGSLYPEHMASLVLEHGADVGLAFDGDADRVIFADEKGEVLDGDQLMAICASHYVKSECLNHKTVVATIMSNIGLEMALRKHGAGLVRTPVGDRYVVEQMRQGGYNLGGEQSGHLVFLDYSTTGDGILSALQILAVMLREERPLSELKRVMDLYPQTLVNVPVNKSKRLDDIPELVALKKDIEQRLGNEGRLVIRPSGTEPVVRVMVEGVDQGMIDRTAEEMAMQIQKHMS